MIRTSIFSQNINDSILKANKIIEIHEFKIDTAGQLTPSSLFIVNSSGKITKEFWISSLNKNDTSAIITYKYDNSGRTINRTDNYNDGSTITKKIDHIGDSVIVSNYKNDSLISKKTIVTLLSGHYTIKKVFNENNILVGTSQEKYRNGKQLYHFKSTVKPKIRDMQVRILNDMNLPIESILTGKNRKKWIKEKWTYSYNEVGLLIKKSLVQTEKKRELKIRYFYEYIKENNGS